MPERGGQSRMAPPYGESQCYRVQLRNLRNMGLDGQTGVRQHIAACHQIGATEHQRTGYDNDLGAYERSYAVQETQAPRDFDSLQTTTAPLSDTLTRLDPYGRSALSSPSAPCLPLQSYADSERRLRLQGQTHRRRLVGSRRRLHRVGCRRSNSEGGWRRCWSGCCRRWVDFRRR